jgi:hypothetical protein
MRLVGWQLGGDSAAANHGSERSKQASGFGGDQLKKIKRNSRQNGVATRRLDCNLPDIRSRTGRMTRCFECISHSHVRTTAA